MSLSLHSRTRGEGWRGSLLCFLCVICPYSIGTWSAVVRVYPHERVFTLKDPRCGI